MFRSLLVAGSIAASTFFMAPAAEARTNFTIYFGVPFYSYQVGPGWRHYDGYGWYDYRRYGEFRRHRNRLTCNQARRLVDRRFDNVRVRECNGRTYTFRAETRRGVRVIVYVNSRTGEIWRG
jgi:hypothetical protein